MADYGEPLDIALYCTCMDLKWPEVLSPKPRATWFYGEFRELTPAEVLALKAAHRCGEET